MSTYECSRCGFHTIEKKPTGWLCFICATMSPKQYAAHRRLAQDRAAGRKVKSWRWLS